MWGKEVVMRYNTDLANDRTFYTDSNGREMLKRVRNERGPSYPKLNVSEPIAGNYYPVNAMIAMNDGKHELAILTDVSQGGSSITNGGLELMVHRRVQQDDRRGVQEPLNETMCGCNDINAAPGAMGEHGHEGDGGCYCAGLTMRGRHWLVFDTIERAHVTRRMQTENLQYPATIAINNKQGATPVRPVFSAVATEFPPNVKLMTMTNNYNELFEGRTMIRLAHLFQVIPGGSPACLLLLGSCYARVCVRFEEAEYIFDCDIPMLDRRTPIVLAAHQRLAYSDLRQTRAYH